MITRRIPVIVLAVTTLILTAAYAQPPGGGRGRFGQGFGRAGDERFQTDRNDFQFLLRNHQKITRTVKPIPGGVETITESDDPAVAAKIKEHTKWMKVRIDQSRPIRMRDPLFRELFRHTDKIAMERVETDKGVHVIETSEDPYVSQLIRAHAKVVSGFVTRGFDEATKNHPVPVKNQGTHHSTTHEYVEPRIEN